MKMKNFLLWVVIILTPLLMTLIKNQYCPDISIFRIYEDTNLYAKQPKINDLYVTTDQGIVTYFKIAGKNAEGYSFIILTGKDTLNNLGIDATKQKELIEENEGFSNMLSFWPIGQFQALVEANEEKTKIYRMYGKPPFVWWDYYRTPISYFTFFLFTFFLLLILSKQPPPEVVALRYPQRGIFSRFC